MSRCIYTGDVLVPGDKALKLSHEHIVPLALGGSNQFTTDDVSADANARAGNEIDDEVASLLPFLMLRHKYGLQGNRRTVPNVKLKGAFTDLSGALATLEIDPNANLSFLFQQEQTERGQLVSFNTTEDRIRFLLQARLKQARQRKLNIFTPFGQIQDEEDIEIVLLLVERAEGKQFKASLTLDLAAFHFAVARLMIKIAIGLGHRVLGPSWTFSPSGDLLREGLWITQGSGKQPPIRGSLSDEIGHVLGPILRITSDKHVMAVLPAGQQTSAIIALFGGELGIGTVDLGIDTLALFENFGDEARGGCVFEIPLAGGVSQRPLVSRTLRQTANEARQAGLLGP